MNSTATAPRSMVSSRMGSGGSSWSSLPPTRRREHHLDFAATAATAATARLRDGIGRGCEAQLDRLLDRTLERLQAHDTDLRDLGLDATVELDPASGARGQPERSFQRRDARKSDRLRHRHAFLGRGRHLDTACLAFQRTHVEGTGEGSARCAGLTWGFPRSHVGSLTKEVASGKRGTPSTKACSGVVARAATAAST